MNLAILIGRLTRDPELRYIPSTGKAVTTFAIAVDRPFTGKDGQKQTDFFNIQVWGKMAENCANYLVKGRLVAVKGSIQNRSYETATGEKKYVTEIQAENVQFLEWGEKQGAGNRNMSETYGEAPIFEPTGFKPQGLDDDGYRALDTDDVPF
ncbi:MAG: single-stranded DNA-binding protein [Filifactoraceae bacterium]